MYYNCSESAPLINKSSSEHMFDTMAMEIEQLLSKVNTPVPVYHRHRNNMYHFIYQ